MILDQAIRHRHGRSARRISAGQARADSNFSAETCCPLPFFLQDLCLLVVINELDCYPTELLAALPYWLRCRILNNVPALDLSRLEVTHVAIGVDTDTIWKSRLKADQFDTRRSTVTISRQSDHVDSTESPSPFQLNVSRDRHQSSSTNPLPYSYHGGKLTKDIINDLNDDVENSKLSLQKQKG